MRVTDEVAAKWAQYRADDAGLAARDLLDCREQLRRVCEERDAAVRVVTDFCKASDAMNANDDVAEMILYNAAAEGLTQYRDSILAARQALEQK